MSDTSIKQKFGAASAAYEPMSGYVTLKVAGGYRQEMGLTPDEFADLEKAVKWLADERDRRKAEQDKFWKGKEGAGG